MNLLTSAKDMPCIDNLLPRIFDLSLLVFQLVPEHVRLLGRFGW